MKDDSRCEPETEPRECFGFQMNWMMEDSLADPEEMRKCFDCPQFDRCNRLSGVRLLHQIRNELRQGARKIAETAGGGGNQTFF